MFQSIASSWNDRLLRLAFLCIMLMGVAVAAIIPYQSIIGIKELGFSPAAYALITTAGSALSVAASVAVGIYSDQTGRYKDMLTRCVMVGVLAGASMVVLPSPFIFILVHVVLFPIAATTFTQYFAMASLAARNNAALDKDMSLSLVRASFAAAFGLTPPLVGVAVANGLELTSIYGVSAVLSAAVLVLVLTSWPGEQTALNEQSGIGFVDSLKELSSVGVLIRVFLVAMMLSTNALYNILLGLLILTDLGGSEGDVGWFAGGVALVEAPVMLMIALALKRFTASGVLLTGCVIYGGFMAALSVLPSMNQAWVMILPAGIGAGILLSVTVGYVQDLVATRPGAGSSLVSVSNFGGIMLGSGILAVASQVTDYAGTARIAAAVGITSALVLFLLDGLRVKKPVQSD